MGKSQKKRLLEAHNRTDEEVAAYSFYKNYSA